MAQLDPGVVPSAVLSHCALVVGIAAEFFNRRTQRPESKY